MKQQIKHSNSWIRETVQNYSSAVLLCGLLLTGCQQRAADQFHTRTVVNEAVLQDALAPRVTKQLATLPYYDDASFSPSWFDSPELIPSDFHTIPSFSLTNQSGQPVSDTDLSGKLYIANFFFATCQGICPSTIGNMIRIQEAVAEYHDVQILSHTVTPEKDTVDELRTFADSKGVVDGKWHLLTGDRQQLYDLGKNYYFADEDLGEVSEPANEETQFLHTESFLLIDGKGYIRGIYNGMNKASVNQLISDVDLLRSA